MIKTIQVNGDIFTFECKYVDLHSKVFKHVCTLSRNGHVLCTETAKYLNRTWETYTYQTVMLRCARNVADNTELINKLNELS